MKYFRQCFGLDSKPNQKRGSEKILNDNDPRSPLIGRDLITNTSAEVDGRNGLSSTGIAKTDVVNPYKGSTTFNRDYIDGLRLRRVSDDLGSEESKSRASTPSIPIQPRSRSASRRSPLGVESGVSDLGYIKIKNNELCFVICSDDVRRFEIHQINHQRGETFVSGGSGDKKNYKHTLSEKDVGCRFKLSFYDKNQNHLDEIFSETITYMSLMSGEGVACSLISSANDDDDGSLDNEGFFHFEADEPHAQRGRSLGPAGNAAILSSNQISSNHNSLSLWTLHRPLLDVPSTSIDNSYGQFTPLSRS